MSKTRKVIDPVKIANKCSKILGISSLPNQSPEMLTGALRETRTWPSFLFFDFPFYILLPRDQLW